MNLLRMEKVTCSTCSTSFRLPEDDLKHGQVQCPFCGHQFRNDVITHDQRPMTLKGQPDVPQARSVVRKHVAFRCAKYGMKFSAWFVSGAVPGAHVLDEIERHDGPPSIIGLFRGPSRVVRQPEAQDDIGSFDFSGWTCPYCKHGRSGVGGAFFECSCGELVCGGRARRTLLGATIYRCHDGCGVEGRASGAIDRLATQSSSQARFRTSKGQPSQALPSRSKRKLLPKK